MAYIKTPGGGFYLNDEQFDVDYNAKTVEFIGGGIVGPQGPAGPSKQGVAVPESYACAVIAATLGECGICGWIRTTKDKRRDKEGKNNEPPTDAAG